MKFNFKKTGRWFLGILFIVAGINHFRSPEIYTAIVPVGLPRPDILQLLAGAAEIFGGLGILIPVTRKAAAWGLILLLLAVFPANVQMALTGWPGKDLPAWVLWARLPFQAVFIAGVYYSCLTRCGKSAFEK